MTERSGAWLVGFFCCNLKVAVFEEWFEVSPRLKMSMPHPQRI